MKNSVRPEQMPMTEGSLPFVSIVMPVRNEADFIERTIQCILNNDYPAGQMEVIVADGCSDDGTQAIIERIANRDSRVILLENAGRIVSTGLNMGLRASKGDIFIRIDGHAEIPPDFIRNSVKCLLNHPDAWIVGGYWKTVSQGYVGKVIAAATQSPVGVGNLELSYAMFLRIQKVRLEGGYKHLEGHTNSYPKTTHSCS
jgi:glycosyltransferase involved in cell wall biosynthesis